MADYVKGPAATRPGPDAGGHPEGVSVDYAHDVKMGREWDDLFGHAHCIWLEPEGGLTGGSDPRADGAALGF